MQTPPMTPQELRMLGIKRYAIYTDTQAGTQMLRTILASSPASASKKVEALYGDQAFLLFIKEVKTNHVNSK